MRRQQGISLVELLAVLTIVSVLGAIAVPYFQDFRLRQALETGEQDIVQGLQKARQMARSQGTFINVQFTQGELSLAPANNPERIERIALPENLEFANATDFMFTPNGTLGLPNGGNGVQLGGLSFDISPRNTQSGVQPRSIQVGSFGSVAGL